MWGGIFSRDVLSPGIESEHLHIPGEISVNSRRCRKSILTSAMMLIY